ncbi:MAG TPA: hypothetical protein VEC56_09190, partial [Candidatus Krumholzibacteria bacterium]|nr:hypothetical protein [Candidatus Krumholzibacteria bacterium]
MESSVRAFRRNLEPFEEERVAGPWRVAGHVDLVSERRYLVGWAPLDATGRLDGDAIAFRCDAAVAIAPEVCAPALEVVVNNGRIEILSPYAAELNATTLPKAGVEAAMSSIVDALARFESHAFFATEVAPELLAVGEEGVVTLLLGAYAVPPDALDAARDGAWSHPRARGCQTHAAGLATIAQSLAALAEAPVAKRLRSLASEIAQGRIRSASEAAACWHGVAMPARVETSAPGDDADIDAIARAIASSQLVEVAGAAESGRTAVLERVLAHLRGAGADVKWLDEWDASTPSRRKNAPREVARGTVWIVDDVEERPLLHSLILDHIFEMEKRAGAGLVVATRSDAPDAFAASLRARAARGVHRVNTARVPAGTDDAILEALDSEARQVLELLAVAAIPMPLDVVLSVMPGADQRVHRHLFALAGAELVAIESRRMPPGGSASLVLRVPRASVRRRVTERIPESRLRNLHRTIARIADERGNFPPLFAYQHLVEAGEAEDAASRAAAFVKESTRAQRAPFLDAI